MRKLVLCLVAGAMMFSCAKDNGKQSESTGAMTLSISAEPEFITKANEISSYEPLQTVDNVMLYIYEYNGSEFIFNGTPRHIDQWRRGETWVNYTMEGADELPVGKYRFVVVGRYKEGDYTVDPQSRFGDMVAKIQNSLSDAQEIFCGYSDEIDIAPGGGRAAIQMKRQVGGLLAYFKNVPQVVNTKTVAFLRVKVLKVTYSMNLISGTQIDASGDYNVIDLDLRSQRVSPSGIYEGNDLSGIGVVTMPLTQLGGTYLLPCGGTAMVVELLDENNNLIKEWRVVNEAGAKEFEVLPNHLYALGTKGEKGNTNRDRPIDLMQNQVLSITIDPNWEVIHDMNLIN